VPSDTQKKNFIFVFLLLINREIEVGYRRQGEEKDRERERKRGRRTRQISTHPSVIKVSIIGFSVLSVSFWTAPVQAEPSQRGS
jgi:hypothetical protein